ncbi:hypothetical protein EFA46_009835 [Halarchaeum sp. CBA1220]|uniref:hypothetical protein n=1 Tax=Halarchaeum sp. CBA1220 TaxID=1853682 RepID=UPI000F3A8B11|nr:hypothetical protein [Halarchaeum sp. CBA1220]QLC34492.1 hypothetical protein EFA46_009835 [Halarchaeum sp. CBA1220]
MDPLVLPLQQLDPFGVQQSLGVAGRAVGTFLGTLIVGALLLAFVDEWFERLLGVVDEEPIPSFLWGIGTLVVFVCVGIIFVITVIGLLLLLPLLVVGLLLKFAGDALVYVYVGGRAAEGLDWETSRWGHLVVGAVFAGLVAAVPAVGGLISFVISSIGVGAIVHTWYRKYDESA